MTKYRAKRVEVDGFMFDSKLEADRYYELKMLEQAGEIVDLELQPVFVLQNGWRDSKGKAQRAITYKADFAYHEASDVHKKLRIVEDTKGMKTPVFRLKERMFRKVIEHDKGGVELRLLTRKDVRRYV